MQGKAIILSAPSGSGKTTIVQHIMGVFPELQFSISATTRKPRGKEVHGKDYYFLTQEEFKSEHFVEFEEVYTGVFYGTLKSEVERIWQNGGTVVFDVDVKGGVNLKKYFREKALAVFVKVPDIEVLKERLTNRGTDSAESLNARFTRIEYEMAFENQFEKVIINDDLKTALKEAEIVVSDFISRQ